MNLMGYDYYYRMGQDAALYDAADEVYEKDPWPSGSNEPALIDANHPEASLSIEAWREGYYQKGKELGLEW